MKKKLLAALLALGVLASLTACGGKQKTQQDAAADGGDDAEHDDTEQVHMPAHGGQRAGGCKGHRADELKKKYEFVHRYR